jgi:hypothetical protein
MDFEEKLRQMSANPPSPPSFSPSPIPTTATATIALDDVFDAVIGAIESKEMDEGDAPTSFPPPPPTLEESAQVTTRERDEEAARLQEMEAKELALKQSVEFDVCVEKQAMLKWDKELAQLREMGFDNSIAILPLLEQHYANLNNDQALETIVDLLLASLALYDESTN